MADAAIYISMVFMLGQIGAAIRRWWHRRMVVPRWRRFARISREVGSETGAGLPGRGPHLRIDVDSSIGRLGLLSVLFGSDGKSAARIWLAGKAGSGKTALIANTVHDALDVGVHPVRLSAADLLVRPAFESTQAGFRHAVGQAHATGLAEGLYRLARRGRVVLLVDDLELLTPDDWPILEERLSFYATHLPRMPIVVASRSPRRAPARFDLVRVQPLCAAALARSWKAHPSVLNQIVHTCAVWRDAADWLTSPLFVGTLANAVDEAGSACRVRVCGMVLDTLFERAGLADTSARSSLGRLAAVLSACLLSPTRHSAQSLVRDLWATSAGDRQVAADVDYHGGPENVVAALRDRLGFLVESSNGLEALHPDLCAYLAAHYLDASPSRFEALMREVTAAPNERWDRALAFYCTLSASTHRWGRIHEVSPLLAGRIQRWLEPRDS